MSLWLRIGTVLFFLYISLFFLQQPHLTTLDLGRHLVNGRELFANPALLKTNFFSFTNPDFPFVNHHWLFGWLAYQVFRVSDFPGVVLLNYVLMTLGVFGSFLLAKKVSSPQIALIATATLLPLVTDRADVRPETISFLFVSLWLLLLSLATKRSFWKILALLTMTQLIWVNTHLFFVFGWVIGGAFLLRSLFVSQFRWQQKGLLLFCLSLPLVSLLNPSGLAGALEPFMIFENYDYPVAENQSLWFFLHYSPTDPKYWYMSLLTILTSLCSAFLLYKRKLTYLPLTITSIFLAALTAEINRVGSFLALAAIPTLAIAIQMFWQKYELKVHALLKNTFGLMITSLVGFGLLVALLASQLFTPELRTLGFRPPEGVLGAARFFESLETTGNIFNNYDIGGFLIYSLYPENKVFIDNRPEAYSSDFITNEYIAAQEDEAVWERVVEKYNLGVIYFYHHDATDWAGPFIIRRVQDPNWVPVYADAGVVILVKNTPEHREIIEQYAVPKEVFGF
ncbi:MAG: hypothetical protein O2840_03660 [bacterium]|nr:hypothetical protein [bacterium]